MNVDQPAYSFDQAQPPTPSRTPTSPAFDSSFQTPKFESSFYDERVTWNTADPNAASPNLLRTPKPLSFETPKPEQFSRFAGAGIQENRHLGFGTNAVGAPATPSAQARALNQSPGIGYTPNFGVGLQPDSPQAGLSLNTSNSFGSAGSLQTPPPTTTSATKRQGKKKQLVQPPPTKSASNRRMSVPIAPKPDQNGGGRTQVEESPQQLASLDFSPDVLGYNFSMPQTAPAYPQHKLFWDTEADTNANFDFGQTGDFVHPQQAGLDPFAGQGFTPQPTNAATFIDFPDDTTPVASFSQANAGPSTSQAQHDTTSTPRYNGVDPSLLFSSPSRPPEGTQSRFLTEEALQPYAHQMQEAKRESAYAGVIKGKKRRKPSVDSPAVKAALETLRGDGDSRPAMRRSMTESNIPGPSRGSSSSRPGSIHGRSSPLKRHRDSSRRSNPSQSLSLTVDENGRAVLVGASDKASNADEMDLDSGSESSSSEGSVDPDEMMTTSVAPRSILPKLGRFNSSASHSQKSSNTSLYSDSQPSLPDLKSRPTTSGPSGSHPRMFGIPPLKPLREATSMEEDALSEAETVMDSEDGDDENAQAQLRKVMKNREEPSRLPRQPKVFSPHTKGNFAQQPDLFLSNISPTTMTDPDLATPSSGNSSAIDNIRCMCGSSHEDPKMIRCESCRKLLHVGCTGHHPQRLPNVYLCVFCTGSTPLARGGRIRDPSRKLQQAPSSPLASKGPRFR